MNAREKRAVTALTAIFALRMLGLFMLLPVLGLYAAQLPAATPLLIGLALGIYGLTQGMLQIPFGMASDRFGRKRVITIGLLIFFGGSVFAALTDSLFGLIIARALQGAGAVSAAVLALTADLTDETSRTKAMAIIGVSIGAVFLLSLMVATPLQSVVGVSGIFWLSAGLALLAIAVLWWVVPEPTSSSAPLTWSASIRRILFERQLLRLNIGVFFLHLILTAIFVTLPALLHIKSGLVLGEHWKIYTPVLILSVVGMLPLLKLGSRDRTIDSAFTVGVGLLLFSTIGMAWASTAGIAALLFVLWVFFISFNVLEAMLPSLVSRIAPRTDKGAATGVYSTFQFIGMFAGGLGGGWISTLYGAERVYWFCALAAGLWMLSTLSSTKFFLKNRI